MFQQVVAHFGSQSELARAMGVSRSAVCQWKALGAIPPKQCKQIEVLTNGKFKALDLVLEYYGINNNEGL